MSKNFEAQIENNFKSHDVTPSQAEHMDMVREGCFRLAKLINTVVPDGRERSISLTELENVMMWANAGIARQQEEN
jgi:hypothetical protein